MCTFYDDCCPDFADVVSEKKKERARFVKGSVATDSFERCICWSSADWVEEPQELQAVRDSAVASLLLDVSVTICAQHMATAALTPLSW